MKKEILSKIFLKAVLIILYRQFFQVKIIFIVIKKENNYMNSKFLNFFNLLEL